MKCSRCHANQRGPDAEGKRSGRRAGGVIETRHPTDDAIRRRYQCWACGFRWSTLEVIGPADDEFRELAGRKFLKL